MSEPHAPVQHAPGQRAPRSRAVTVAALVALVLVVGAVGFALGLVVGGGEEEPSDRADSNARAACVILERTDPDDPLPEGGLDDPATWELMAVAGLTGAAAAGDDDYEDLDEEGQVVGQAIATRNLERLAMTVRAASEECDELGLG